MNTIKRANEILNKLPYPITVNLTFKEVLNGDLKSVEPHLLQEDIKFPLKILLNFPFYLYTGKNAALIFEEEAIIKLKIKTRLNIESIIITELFIMEIRCKECTLIALPSLYFGWGIYKNGKEILQHQGWEEGIEWSDEI
jgi:hypothetical protein